MMHSIVHAAVRACEALVYMYMYVYITLLGHLKAVVYRPLH